TRGTGRKSPPARTVSDIEAELAGIHPAPIGTPLDFLERRNEIEWAPELNEYLAREILAAADGVRSGLDLYHLARAEVNEAGAYYYSAVTATMVLDLFRSADRARLFRLH